MGKHEDIKLNPRGGVGGRGSLLQLPQFLLGNGVKMIAFPADDIIAGGSLSSRLALVI